MDETTRGFALVGPVRAGTTISAALVAAGYRCVAVAGRPGSPSVPRAASRFDAPVTEVADAGRNADVVVLATPDAALRAVATELVPGLRAGALVVHLAGSRGVDALEPITAARDDIAVGALHPLQTLTGDPTALQGSWAAVAGPPAVRHLAGMLGLQPFTVAADQRAGYHAAAVVASNHVVALLAQVERLATRAGVPFEAFEPLVSRSVANGFAAGPAAALTGPVARGDIDTVQRHLDAIGDDEQRAYRALADAARRLAGRDEPALREALA